MDLFIQYCRRRRYNFLPYRWLGCLLELVFQVFDIPWITEALPVGVSQPVCSKLEDTEDLIRPFLGWSEVSFRWVFGRQGDLAYDPIPNSKRARSYPRVVVPRDTLLVSFIPKVGLRLAFFNQIKVQCECCLICISS